MGRQDLRVSPAGSVGRWATSHRDVAAPRSGLGETRKSFASFFKSCGVWGGAPRSRGCKGRRSRLPARSALDGAHRAPAPCLPLLQKRGDRRPPLGVPQSPGFLLEEGAGRVAQRPLPGLSPVGRVRPVRCIFPPAAPVKAVELCSTPRKLLKKFDQNFSLSLSHPSAAPYTMRNKGWLNSTTWPLPTQISATVPSTSAGISFISFMASMMHRVSPFFTWSPTSTKGRASGLGAE